MKTICVIGTGYVGLVTGTSLADFGNKVYCVDIDEKKIDFLRNRHLPIYEPGLKELVEKNINVGRLLFTINIEKAIRESEVVFICVGTPPKENGKVDTSQIENVVAIISKNLYNYKIIVTKSTVPVGTNRWIKRVLQEEAGISNVDVISNPEFLREGKAVHDVFHPDRVVIGYESERAKNIIEEVYRALFIIETPFLYCDYETAELIKYAANAFLATKITFINQIANLCEAIGADVHKVAKGIGMDGRINQKFLHPGPGFGGSCFPKDTKALVSTGEEFGVEMSLVKEVITSNEKQKERMVEKIEKLLENDLSGKRIALLGIAFKAETDDIRDTPAKVIVNKLLKRGVKIVVHDPQALENAKIEFGETIEYINDEYEAIKDSDAIIILTEWNQYRSLDLKVVKEKMKGNIILDTRNILEPDTAKKFGFIYEGVGRK